jgi:pyoverdine/dityrosine biosynthesis protein Dit1
MIKDLQADQSTEQIIRLIHRIRRFPVYDRAQCGQSPCPQCHDSLLEKISFVRQKNESLRFVIPSFPYKSPNHRVRTLSDKPDMAESLAISHLADFVGKVNQVYPAELVIASDGRVFAGLQREWWPGFDDSTVTSYNTELKKLALTLGIGERIAFWGLDDAFPNDSPDTMRDRLNTDAPTPDEMRKRVCVRGSEAECVYLGSTKFRFEELKSSPLTTGWSNKKIEAAAKKFTREQMRLGEAWGRLIERHFPDAVRLSVHPRPHSSGTNKIGIHLFPRAYATPWHVAAVFFRRERQFIFAKRAWAEEAGARLAFVDDVPSHYVL